MDPRIKMVINNIGKAVLIIFTVNLILFLITFWLTDRSGDWGWGFKHGIFSVNGEQIGLSFSSMTTRVLLAIMFLSFTLSDLRRLDRKGS